MATTEKTADDKVIYPLAFIGEDIKYYDLGKRIAKAQRISFAEYLRRLIMDDAGKHPNIAA